MKQTLKLKDIYAADLFSRSRVSELLQYINSNTDEIVLDFDGINFISRSFADELCNIMDDNNDKKFVFVGQIAEVQTMISRVQESRKQERKRGIMHPKMYSFNNMESLSSFLMSM
jgi:GTP1/Obg family GTP-binding protein